MGELPQLLRVAAYNVCVDADERLLLVRLSAITEAPGAWTLPGGGLHFGEHPEAGALRELREETGLEGRLVELLTVDSIHRILNASDGEYEYHGLRIIYRTEIVGGELADERDESTDAAAWFTRADVADLSIVGTGALGLELAFGGAPS